MPPCFGRHHKTVAATEAQVPERGGQVLVQAMGARRTSAAAMGVSRTWAAAWIRIKGGERGDATVNIRKSLPWQYPGIASNLAPMWSNTLGYLHYLPSHLDALIPPQMRYVEHLPQRNLYTAQELSIKGQEETRLTLGAMLEHRYICGNTATQWGLGLKKESLRNIRAKHSSKCKMRHTGNVENYAFALAQDMFYSQSAVLARAFRKAAFPPQNENSQEKLNLRLPQNWGVFDTSGGFALCTTMHWKLAQFRQGKIMRSVLYIPSVECKIFEVNGSLGSVERDDNVWPPSRDVDTCTNNMVQALHRATTGTAGGREGPECMVSKRRGVKSQ
ncbi:hypothetical protein B0H13DRAFT_1851437 [Mycena leptocephala]|nr:hypothetical protein B0H13DRAFT_1851437 [Mycena leptocephala]